MVASSFALIAPPAHAADPIEVNLLGTNDFHGRIQSNGVEAGAAVLAGAVKQIRAQHPNTVFSAAGDLIGASTFESFIAHDKPTLDALNEAGLEVSAVGNHEFDQGYDDLVNRVMKPESEANPDGGAQWKYIGANVKMRDTGADALDPTFVKDFGAVQVGFVGAVTEHLPELVSPGGIKDITVTDIPTAVNAEANALKAEGVDLVVLLVHEGAPNTNCATMDDDPTSDFGSIIDGVNDNVDAIISGHTHLAYDCKFPVAGWAGRAVTERPVVSAGQYGYNLNELTYSLDPDTLLPASVNTSLLSLTTKNPDGTFTPNYPSDPATASIVQAAKDKSDVLGAQPLGQIAGPLNRAKLANGTTENRGGESTLGNLVAEAQRWATASPTTGSAQIAFMNPGGLRADMVGQNTSGYPAVLTYKQAATVQPFANTLVNMHLTGDQIATVLEQQWQPAGSSRPFLRLGMSKGFTYAYDPSAGAGDRIQQMWLDGTPIRGDQTYSVTVNSFLATGGDNFFELANGTDKKDTGKTDLQGMVDYMAAFAADGALPVDYTQRSVGVTFPEDAPAAYGPGDQVAFDLSSLAFSTPADTKDSRVTVSFDGHDLGRFRVDNTVGTDIRDEYGTSAVSVNLPAYYGSGASHLTVTGATTGTTVQVPVTLKTVKAPAQLRVTHHPRRIVMRRTRAVLTVAVTGNGEPATGTVGARTATRSYTSRLRDGGATLTLARFRHPGLKRVTVSYGGDDATRNATKVVYLRVVRK
jgi:5'-nucleotidase